MNEPSGRPIPVACLWPWRPAWFETGEDADEGTALRWLERLGDPEIALPSSNDVFPRKVVEMYLPVNDSAGPSKAIVQSAPSITRDRKERTFPTVSVGDAPCFLIWPNATATDIDINNSALDRLCGKVTRIGHSSSLVRMWMADDARSACRSEIWVPDNGLAEFQARTVSEGTLNLLDRWFNRHKRDEFERLSGEIANLEAAKKVKGKGAKERRVTIDIEIGKVKGRLKVVDNHAPIRPKLGLWSGYRRREPENAHSRTTHRFR